MTQPRISQRVLEAIAAGAGDSEAAAAATGMTPKQVSNGAQKLRRRGLLEITNQDHYRLAGQGIYRITEAGTAWLAGGRAVAGGQSERRNRLNTRGLRVRAWWLMRELRKFTLADLLSTLADGTESDARSNLAKYLAALEDAGIVHRMKRRTPRQNGAGRGNDIWMLKQDLGRHAPVARHTHREVFDPNAGAVLRAAATLDLAQPQQEAAHA